MYEVKVSRSDDRKCSSPLHFGDVKSRKDWFDLLCDIAVDTPYLDTKSVPVDSELLSVPQELIERRLRTPIWSDHRPAVQFPQDN